MYSGGNTTVALLGGIRSKSKKNISKKASVLSWNEFVKKFSLDHACSRQDAMVLASPHWKRYKKGHARAFARA